MEGQILARGLGRFHGIAQVADPLLEGDDRRGLTRVVPKPEATDQGQHEPQDEDLAETLQH